jgi:hypothetical protein
MDVLLLTGWVFGLILLAILAVRFGVDSRDIERQGPDF